MVSLKERARKKKTESLKERAIKAYEEWEQQHQRELMEQAEKFAREAVKEFTEVFGKPQNVEPMSERTAKIATDGLTFIARKEYTDYCSYIKFYLQTECTQCHNPFIQDTSCESIIDLGHILSKPQVCRACRYGTNTETTTKSPAERVLELATEILEIIQEEHSE